MCKLTCATATYHHFFVQVHDRRDEEFIFRLPWNTFPGEGQATCGEKGESSEQYTLCPVNNTMILPKVAPEVEMLIRHCHSHASLLVTGKKLSTNQFLKRLPKVVVKAGRVIDIRDSLRATLQVSSKPRPV